MRNKVFLTLTQEDIDLMAIALDDAHAKLMLQAAEAFTSRDTAKCEQLTDEADRVTAIMKQLAQAWKAE